MAVAEKPDPDLEVQMMAKARVWLFQWLQKSPQLAGLERDGEVSASLAAEFRSVAQEAHARGFEEARKRAAQLHEIVRTWCDHEPDAGAGAMGTVIDYRDQIRALQPKESR